MCDLPLLRNTYAWPMQSTNMNHRAPTSSTRNQRNLGFWADRYTPTHRGFDSYLGYLSPDEQYFTHYKWPPYGGGAGSSVGYNTSLPNRFNITDLCNGTEIPTAGAYDGVYSTYMYATEADRIISTAAARKAGMTGGGAPFFLYLAAQSIHTPLEAPLEYMAMYPDAPNGKSGSDAQIIHAMVTALDDLVGNVTNALKIGGLWENTLVVFTSDNGGDTHGNNYPLRGGKFTTWEGGLRVVGAVSGGAIPSACDGRVADGLIHIADWHATLAHLANTTINATGPRPLDSINVWDHLASCGTTPSARTTLMHHYDGPSTGAYREGDLKLIIGSMSPYCWDTDYPLEEGKSCKAGVGDPHPIDWQCTPCKSVGPNPCSAQSPCLFNVSSLADPLEHTDIASAHPEIVSAMVSRYTALGADTCTPHLGSCLDYIGVADQAAWVQRTLDTMHIGPLPNAGEPQPGRPPSPAPPPTPPVPPIDVHELAGDWSSDKMDRFIVTLTGPSTVHVLSRCDQCCWDSANGTILISTGREIKLNATSASCARFVTGRVNGSPPDLRIDWSCMKPNSESCSWPQWSKGSVTETPLDLSA
jgi:hypothetical protein